MNPSMELDMSGIFTMARPVWMRVVLVLCACVVCTVAQDGRLAGERTFSTFEDDTDKATGEVRHDFDVNKADVRTVFKALSSRIGIDIVAGDGVQGTVTLSVTNKTWKEIFLIVCRILNLTPIKEDAYLYVVTDNEFKRQQLERENSSVSAPLTREIIVLSNTTADEMRGAVQTMLSPRGRITVAEHNNALIILDTKDIIAEIRSTLAQLDVETQQISISCKIIEVSSGNDFSMGVHWGYFNNELGIDASNLNAAGVVANALGKLSYGILTPERFSVALEYLYEDKQGEIVAQPSITTLDNKEAKIFTGQQIPLTTLDDAGNTQVTLIDAGTELTVTPHVTGEGRIMLELNPKKKSYELNATGQPIINEQSAQTNVVVSDGETVVIAGLTSNEKQNAEGGIPLLKDIPLIGNLFKRAQKKKANKDLIIFVTPYIIHKQVEAASDAAAN